MEFLRPSNAVLQMTKELHRHNLNCQTARTSLFINVADIILFFHNDAHSPLWFGLESGSKTTHAGKEPLPRKIILLISQHFLAPVSSDEAIALVQVLVPAFLFHGKFFDRLQGIPHPVIQSTNADLLYVEPE